MDEELRKYLISLLTEMVSVGDEMFVSIKPEEANQGVWLEHLKVKTALMKLKQMGE